MTDSETLAEILRLLRKIDGELGAVPDVRTMRQMSADFVRWQQQQAEHTQQNTGLGARK